MGPFRLRLPERTFIMAIHAKNKTLKEKLTRLNDSETLFNRYVLDCVKAGFLTVGDDSRKKGVDISETSYEFIQKYGSIVSYVPLDAYVDGARTLARPLKWKTSGIAHSPSKEQKRSSKSISQNQMALRILRNYMRDHGVERWNAYFVTMTIPNVDLGTLHKSIKMIHKAASQMMTALRNANSNKNGLRLVCSEDDDGNITYTEYLGGLMALEVTINPVKLHRKDGKGLFHPHVHLLIQTKDPISCSWLKQRLFSYWKAKFGAKLYLSPKAFKVERSWNDNDSISELNKYAVKPDFYMHFSRKPNSFTMSVFSELLKSIKNVKMHITYGWLRNATRLVKKMSETAVGRYVMSAINAGLLPADQSGYAPDIVTSVATISNKAFDVRGLGDDELIYANQNILKYSLWHKPQNIKYPDTVLGQWFKELIDDITFASSIWDVLDNWRNNRQAKVDSIDNRLHAKHVTTMKKNVLNKRLRVAEAQLDDVDKLIKAVSSHISRDGFRLNTHDYSERYNKLALFRTLDYIGVRFTWKTLKFNRPFYISGNGKTIDVDMPWGLEFPPDATVTEEDVCQLYLKTDWSDDIKFVDPSVVLEYFMWKYPKWEPKFDGYTVNLMDVTDVGCRHGYIKKLLDEKTISLVNTLTDEDFQDWVNVTFSKKSKKKQP